MFSYCFDWFNWLKSIFAGGRDGDTEAFEELECWQEARKLVRLVYKLTRKREFSRDFALVTQVRKSSVSSMSNIAEGFESQTQSLFIKYLGIAKASAGEVRSQLYIASDLGYLSPEDLKNTINLTEKVSRLIFGFIKYLQSLPNPKRI